MQVLFGGDIAFDVPFDNDVLCLRISENSSVCSYDQFGTAGQISVDSSIQANGLYGGELSLDGCVRSNDAGI